jgi:hypothetical protein
MAACYGFVAVAGTPALVCLALPQTGPSVVAVNYVSNDAADTKFTQGCKPEQRDAGDKTQGNQRLALSGKKGRSSGRAQHHAGSSSFS